MSETDPAAALEADAAALIAQARAATAPKDYAAIVSAWVNATINGSPVARNVDAWNYLTTAGVADLIKRLSS